MEHDPKKIEALQQAEAPSNVSELKFSSGMDELQCTFYQELCREIREIAKVIEFRYEKEWKGLKDINRVLKI